MTRPWGRVVAAACLLAAQAGAVALPDAAPDAPTIAMVLPREEQAIEAGFREGLRQRGMAPHVELVRWSGRAEDQEALVARLRALAPDLVYTWGAATTLAVAGPVEGEAGRYIRDRPMVFTDVDDPVASKLVAQWAPPGRNLTGVPRLASLAARGAELLYLGDSGFLTHTHRGTVTRLAREAGLATFCAAEGAVRQSGCLFGLFSEAGNTGRFAAYKAWQILRGGQHVQDVPIETLQRFSLVINMPVARELALYPPMAVLQAAEVVSPPLAPLRQGP